MYTLKLEAVDKRDTNVGIKIGRLGELVRTGLPVPPGFVLTADAYYRFLKMNRIDSKIEELLGKVDIEDTESLNSVSSQIRNMIINGSVPDFVEKEVKEAYEELAVGKEVKEIGGIALDMVKAGRGREFVAVRPSLVNCPANGFTGCGEAVLNVAGLKQLLEAVKR